MAWIAVDQMSAEADRVSCCQWSLHDGLAREMVCTDAKYLRRYVEGETRDLLHQ